MLPEITLPTGATEYEHNTPNDETWWMKTPYDQTITMLEKQLPIGQTFRGVPFCSGATGPPSPVITAWTWSTATEDLTVFVSPPGSVTTRGQLTEVEFRWEALPDGNGRENCTAPMPASVNAEPPPGPVSTNSPNSGPLPHSDKAEIDMPPGSWLSPSNPETVRTNSEIWNYVVSRPDMVSWLRQRLPIGKPFHGIAWCEEDPELISFEWIGGGQRFYAQVTDYGLVEFQRGPIQGGC